jgi:hypothetical protein
MLSEVFYTFLITTASALVLKLCSMFYKSKCKEVKFCCLKIIRDVDIEEKGDEFEITNKKVDTIN